MLIDGANTFTAEELDQLFSDELDQGSPLGGKETDGQNNDTDVKTEKEPKIEGADNTESNVDTTKAFAKRLKESTDKARLEERNAIAKTLGFETYEEFQKSREKEMLEEKGLDPDKASSVVDELVKKRIESDPRIQELEQYRKQRVEEFGKRELAEITKLTNGEITSLAQLPKEVIDLWKTKGSLKSAYLELEGEKLITKIRSEQIKGSTGHLANVTGATPPPNNKRPLTTEEKRYWKIFNPQMTDAELDKVTVDK